jgi:ubiquitin-activating enzyme E1
LRSRGGDAVTSPLNILLLFSLPTTHTASSPQPPAPLSFDLSDPLHQEFIVAVASMRAATFQLPVAPGDLDPPALAAALAGLRVDEFQPQDGVTIATTEEEAKNEGKQPTAASSSSSASASGIVDVDAQCDALLRALPTPAQLPSGFGMKAMAFEKDDDAHMRVVAAAGNLRARNYKIPEADLHAARGIAGKITPAIATTTALVTGFICMEMYKLLQDKPVTAYANTFSSLAVNLYTSMEPQPPNTTTSTVKGEVRPSLFYCPSLSPCISLPRPYLSPCLYSLSETLYPDSCPAMSSPVSGPAHLLTCLPFPSYVVCV